ncbi:HDOD domain-containing protein [Paenibacillus sp. TRM 82003]|uniref:HDOD domain-containing protein n=1 Tax=Kineococcus sp. TRM81007 TaxID=2925831 RepID=UPI001F56CDE8|nr:HDOD domain-containing protein [Kineococcus sp. TRM81007]MCI2240411.1 HDOD domain-containing protein [Kineococcus sp. TRM81007]MCI3927413.1 HDOD domain-containing protein [Paenibacillus sp. TRM 82003]
MSVPRPRAGAAPPVPASAPGTSAAPGGAVEVLGRISAALDDLPAHRPVAARVIAQADDHRSDARSLGQTLGCDPALTAKVLRLANSAYFGLSGRVSAPAFAVTVVGFSTVRSLAVAAMAGLEDVPESLEEFWERSVLTAVAAGEVAGRLGVKAPDAFSLGLLARLGQALLVRCDPDRYPAVLAGAADREELLAAEVHLYGSSHTRVSAEALAAWSFPDELPAALAQVDAPGWASPLSVSVRLGVELSERLLAPARAPRPAGHLSGGRVDDGELDALRSRVQQVAQEMLRLLAA